MSILLVMIGGFFGAIFRFALGKFVHLNNGFPLGTFLINISGCFILGWFLTYVSQDKKVRPEFTLIIGTGFIGSLQLSQPLGTKPLLSHNKTKLS